MSGHRGTSSDDADQRALAVVVARQRYVHEMNEKISSALPYRTRDKMRLLCECGRRDCNDWFAITIDVYAYARRRPRWRMLLEGHEHPELDKVVERRDGFTIVESIVTPAGRRGE